MSRIFISSQANAILPEYLRERGHSVSFVKARAGMNRAIASHPDIYMCCLGDTVFHGDPSLLLPSYPGDSIYNGCSTGHFFIHNLNHTAPDLLSAVEKAGQTVIHVSQGYSKCNCVVVDEKSIITADKGIERAAAAAGLDVLPITKAQVLIEGYQYGFLGGASGRVGDEIIFNGDLSQHSDYAAIREFIENRGLRVVFFRDYPLTDIGSIIEERS